MPDFTYTVVSAGGANTGQGGIMPTPPSAQGMPPAWLSYVTVDDADTTAQQAEKLGGKTWCHRVISPKWAASP